jgi:hypothetical protein
MSLCSANGIDFLDRYTNKALTSYKCEGISELRPVVPYVSDRSRCLINELFKFDFKLD